MRFKNFVWDFDGTLFNTYPHMVKSMQRALQEMGVPAAWEEVYRHMKKTVPETVAYYSQTNGLDEKALLALYTDIRHQEQWAEQEPYPGARELLTAILTQGGRNYLFTHRGQSARDILKNVGMMGLFEEAVTALEGFPRKPDPSALLYLIRKHGLVPAETIMIGDRLLDVQTGENAGTAALLFDPEHYYDGCQAALRADSMEEIGEVLEVMNMDFLSLAAERYSVRAFSDRPVEEEKLQKVLESGRLAPTAKNNQPQRIYVLKSPAALETVQTLTPCAFGAPVVLMVCGDTKEAWAHPDTGHASTEMDVSIVTTHMMLEAWEQGLGSTWVCRFDTERARTAFHLPETVQPFCLLPIGYAAETAQPSPNHGKRKQLEETVTVL